MAAPRCRARPLWRAAVANVRFYRRTERHRGHSLQLLLLLRMQRVLPQPRAVLLELQLLASRLAAEGIVQIARLITGEEDNFRFLLAFGHATRSRQIAPLSRRSRLSNRSRILAGITVNQKGRQQ